MPAKQNKFSLKLTTMACLLAMLPLSVFAAGVTAPESSTVNTASPVSSISDIYSDIDMRMRLSTKTSTAACAANQCEENRVFDARVGAIGSYLSKSASQLYPKQDKLIKGMTFSVVNKQEPGTASNNKGQIVVLRGVQDLQLSDDALSFVVAREMSHVLAGHHKTNTSTKLIISALASVLFPAVAIIGASSAAAQASTATTLLTSAASTATSMLGGEVALAKMKPTQLSQADEMALIIMDNTEWDIRSTQNVLLQGDPVKSAWMLDLEISRAHLANRIAKEDAEIIALEDDFVLEDIGGLALDETLTELPMQEQNTQDLAAIESLQESQETVLKSSTTDEAGLDGVKITPLPANIDAASRASP